MDIDFLNNIRSCFHNLIENEITTLSKLTPSEAASVAVGFMFIIAGCFMQERK